MAKQAKEKKVSLGETLQMTKRALSVWWKAAPDLFVSRAADGAVSVLASYVPLYFTARLVNEVAGARDPGRLWRWTLALLLVLVVAKALQALIHRWAEGIEIGKQNMVLENLYCEKLLSMDFCDVDDPATQALLDEIQQNCAWGYGLPNVYWNLLDGFQALFNIAGGLALSAGLFLMPVPADSSLVWLNHPLCMVGMLALVLLATVLSPMLSGKGQSYWYAVDTTLSNRVRGFCSYIGFEERQRSMDIRTYEQDGYFRAFGQMPGLDAYSKGSPLTRAMAGPGGLAHAGAQAVTYVLTGAIYLFVGLKALGGAFGVGLVAQYVGALAGLSSGVSTALQVLNILRQNAPYLRPVYKFLDTPNNMYQGSLTTEKRSDRKYEIEFRDVSFQYPNTDAWALRHVSMKFNVGERLAVVGENGSGKTTFIKLLCRLYDPTEGEILLNGIDIRKYRYDNYLDLFSVVFQDFQLLAQPLGQNVAASMEYDREKAARCLERAGFSQRLAELPKGLDTCLYRDFEDDGVEISGGEAQKIALARVLYQNAPFIVLDEPTAALDPEAEAEIYTKFNDIVEDKTAIYISHRLSSCRFCNEIAVFDHGQVVQQGAHDDLVEAQGKYRDLWEAQAQYYQNKEA